ncbi:interferon-induced protein 44-like, partial [Plectropomus leopardus]|uniref:interferon-induced protein 44-like n=1 Tax=Plectropomus leopardus TaxID=160734 RepID=UPI001C4CADA8
YTTFKIHKDPESYYSFIFNDIMGFEQKTNKGVSVEDVVLALRGHVMEGYKFLPESPLQDSDQGYKSSPTLADRVHVLVCVIPAGLVPLISKEVVQKMRNVRLAASEMGIPQLAILTKIDESCPKVKKDVIKGYKSKYLNEQVDKFSMLLGIPPNCIFLAKNYNSEVGLNDGIDTLTLGALRQIINYGEDFLNNL